MKHLRTNGLMAQKVDVGIVFLDMLGEADGVAYLQRAGVPAHVIERITRHPRERRRQASAPEGPCASNDCPGMEDGACRRR